MHVMSLLHLTYAIPCPNLINRPSLQSYVLTYVSLIKSGVHDPSDKNILDGLYNIKGGDQNVSFHDTMRPSAVQFSHSIVCP
jgi:hypothetical protein